MSWCCNYHNVSTKKQLQTEKEGKAIQLYLPIEPSTCPLSIQSTWKRQDELSIKLFFHISENKDFLSNALDCYPCGLLEFPKSREVADPFGLSNVWIMLIKIISERLEIKKKITLVFIPRFRKWEGLKTNRAHDRNGKDITAFDKVVTFCNSRHEPAPIIQGLTQSEEYLIEALQQSERGRDYLSIPFWLIAMYGLQVIKQLFVSYWMQYNIVIDIRMKEVKVSLQSTFMQKANYSVILSLLFCQLLLLKN